MTLISILRNAGLGVVVTASRHCNCAPQQVAMVGDSLHDLNAARAAGSVAVAVLSGPARRAVLAPHADVVLDSIADVPAWSQAR